MTLALEPEVGTTVAFLDKIFARTPLEHVSIKLWDGTLWPDDTPRPATVVLKHPGSLRAMLESGNAKGLAEAYVRGECDVEGDFEHAVEMALALEHRPHGWLEALRDFYLVHRLPAGGHEIEGTEEREAHRPGTRHSPARDREVVSFHYDLSNDFYALWLDREMTYSCAYFETTGTSLEEAQHAKYRMLCSKLRLRQGQRLLDIGCGWGGFARHAARRYGVDVVGVTLSGRQAALAVQRAREEGLSERVKIEQVDYRNLEFAGEFDAVASIGMAEHVGRENLKDYFETVRALLKPGGVFLNHAISSTRPGKRFHGPSFIDAHVFPDSDIPQLPLVLDAAEAAGWEIRDVENLREHYALTLRHWVHRLETHEEEARSIVGERVYRTWRLYMAASAHGFDHGDLAVYQTLLAKPDENGSSGLPLTRRDWYAE